MQQNATYSITWSARASNAGGTVRPSALAVDILMTNSNVAERKTGQIGWLYAPEDAPNVGAHLPEDLCDAGAIAHQAADFRELTCSKRGRNRVARRQRG